MTDTAHDPCDRASDGKRYGLTAKQEAFCHAYREVGNASGAYRLAYPACLKWQDSTIWEAASRLMAHSKVAARIKQLSAASAKRHETTVDSLTEELRAASKLAHANGQAGAAVQAVMGKAKLHGLLVDKHEDVTQPDDMSPAELAEHLADLDRKLIAAMPEADLQAHESYLQGHLADTRAELARRSFKVVSG